MTSDDRKLFFFATLFLGTILGAMALDIGGYPHYIQYGPDHVQVLDIDLRTIGFFTNILAMIGLARMAFKKSKN